MTPEIANAHLKLLALLPVRTVKGRAAFPDTEKRDPVRHPRGQYNRQRFNRRWGRPAP